MTDQFDAELRDRLARVAAAVPAEPQTLIGRVQPTSVRPGTSARRLAIGGLVPILAVAVVGTLLANVTKVGPFAPGASVANGPVVATTRSGDFELAIRSAKAAYEAGEPIEIEASLAYLGHGAAVIRHGQGATVPGRGNVDGPDTGGTGGPIGFGVVEPVLDDLRLGTGWDLSCERSTLEPGRALHVPFEKGSSWPTDHPRAAEYRAFIEDPSLRLTPGTWHVYAVAEFTVGECATDPIKMRVDLTIEVGNAVSATSDPTEATTTAPEASASPIQPDGSVLSVAGDGAFELRLRAVSGTQFTAHTPIDLFTTYEFVGPELPGRVTVAHFQPEIAFAIEQLGVQNNLIRSKVYDSDCSERELEPGIPAAVPYSDGNLMSIEAVTVGGTFDAALQEGYLSLPEGQWRISAYLDTYVGGCPARSEAGHHTLGTSIEISVVADASVEIELRTASGPHTGICMTALGGGTLARNPRTGLGFEDGGIVTDVIWPYGWTARTDGERVVLYNEDGEAEALAGDQVAFGGGHIGQDGDPIDTFAICGGPVISPTPS